MRRTSHLLLVAGSKVAVAVAVSLAGGGLAMLAAGRADAAAPHSTSSQRADAPRASWTAGVEIPGTATLNAGGDAAVLSVSCASAGNCTAGGYYDDPTANGQAFVADEVSGTWHSAIELPGTAALNAGAIAEVTSVSCATAGNCVAGGSYQDASGNAQAFVADEVNGTWQTAIEVPGTATLDAGGGAEVDTTSCTSPGNCAAGGYYNDAALESQAFVAVEVNGTWGAAIEVPGTATLNAGGTAEVSSMSCSSPSGCTVGGFYSDASQQGQAFVASDVSGTWQAATEVPGTAVLNAGGDAQVTSVSCSPDGSCTVGGFYDDGAMNSQAFLASEVSGSWQTAIGVPGIAALNVGDAKVVSVSCTSANSCSAGGYFDRGVTSAASRPFVVDEVNGVWQSAIEVPGAAALDGGGSAVVNAVSCPVAGDCAAAGDYVDAAGNAQTFVAEEVGGTWQSAIEVPGMAALNTDGDSSAAAVSCAAPGECLVGGFYADPDGLQALVDSSTLAPVVTSVSPSVGLARGGTTTVIEGVNLLGASSVLFGARQGTNLEVESPGAIRVAAPPGAGTVNVTVTTPLGRSAVDVGDRFSYALAPVVALVSPASGPSRGGTVVVVRGARLFGASSVHFGAREGAHLTVVNARELKVRTPPGSGTVRVQVTTPGGSSVVTARTRFVYRVTTHRRRPAPRAGRDEQRRGAAVVRPSAG